MNLRFDLKAARWNSGAVAIWAGLGSFSVSFDAAPVFDILGRFSPLTDPHSFRFSAGMCQSEDPETEFQFPFVDHTRIYIGLFDYPAFFRILCRMHNLIDRKRNFPLMVTAVFPL